MRAAAPFAAEAEALPAASRDHLGIGLNPLVQAASPLLLVAGQVRGSVSPMDVAGLRRYTVDEMKVFEERARAAGVKNEVVLAARYALCAGLDEAVLSTPWGAQSEWAQHPMLVAFHREAWGGEKFFEMLDRISVDPAKHIDLMELQYLVLALGFTGKYQMIERGHEQLADLQQSLYRKIRSERGPADQELALQWRGLEDRRNRLIRYVPGWVVAIAALTVLALAFVVFYSRLAQRADPIHEKLALVGVGDPQVPPSPPLPGPTLKQLLAPDEAAGALTVAETGRRTVVTIKGSDLFGSGSAEVNPAYEPTLKNIAAAVNRVKGQITIVGHTDNQRIKSLVFSDNYDLSRARALSVANVLRQTLDKSVNPSVQGVGPSKPIAPGDDPESRARNRRVEILHIR